MLEALHHGGQCSDLYLIKVLNISYNKFTQLPNDIRYLVSVTELYVQHNNLLSLPDSIQYLVSLEILDVSENRLRHLPSALGKLNNLRVLKVNGNSDLNMLCPELCHASNLTLIELDSEQYTFPPSDITIQGTEAILKYLCEKSNLPYRPCEHANVEISRVQSANSTQNPFTRPTILWEQQEAAIMEQENKFHEAAKLQREKFLSKVLQDQSNLDAEIAKVQVSKDAERLILIKAIQQDEKAIECLVNNFIKSDNLRPEVIQQQLQHEQAEHDHLLTIIKHNNDNIRKADILKSMEAHMNENLSVQLSKRTYEDNFDSMKQSLLMQELKGTEKLQQLLTTKDQSRSMLVHQLMDDQDVQKAVVASLVEKVDARSWSLNQEIALISSNLAKLSVIEQEKKKMHVAYNFNELLNQRVHLLNLLDDLLAQQNKRRKQLVQTLKEMDDQRDSSTDFWLRNYQKLMESAPKTLLSVGKTLDPLFAHYLLQEGVIHCLPFLVNVLFSNDSLLNVTIDMLKDNGVTLMSDRESIMRAINLYIIAKSENHNYLSEKSVEPSAPLAPMQEETITGMVNTRSDAELQNSECVICMDARCEVAFVPCGHLCCCLACSENELKICPMCRGNVERKIKIIVP